jgi:hypothetical protein
MHTNTFLLSAAGIITSSFIAIGWLNSSETVRIRAVETVPLFEPGSLAGKIGDSPKEVGQLKAGEELAVSACIDRKSDINLYAFYQGRVVAVGDWKAKIQLLRSQAYPWEEGAITSCQGYFENVSTRT